MTTKSFLLFFREINSKMDSFPTQNENTSKSTTSITRSFLTKNTKKKPQARKKNEKQLYYTHIILLYYYNEISKAKNAMRIAK